MSTIKIIKQYWEQTPFLIKALIVLIILIPLEISLGTLFYSIIEGCTLSLSNIHFGNSLLDKILQTVLIVITMILIAGGVFSITKYIRDKFSKSNTYEYDITQPLKSKRFYLSCLKTYIVMFLVNLITSITLNHGKAITTNNQSKLNATFSSSLHGLIWIVLESILIAPVIEEFLFRWNFFEPIKKLIKNFIIKNPHLKKNAKTKYISFGRNLAWIYSSVAFSFLHIPTNIMSFWMYFWMGICIGYIYKKWDSIYASMFFHSSMNLLTICFMLIHF